jgi:hypothetical protein
LVQEEEVSEGDLLWKYLGVAAPRQPRITFLEDALFRITQPLALNDPFEVKPRILLDQYAEEDWAVARKLAQQARFPSGDDEMIRAFILESYPRQRMDEKAFPGLYPAHIPEFRKEPFTSIAEIDEFRASRVRAEVEQVLNSNIGVFSVSEEPLNLLMWAHYGAEHWGTAVGLDLRHAFFGEIGANLQQVKYLPQRVAVSSNGGRIRVAGHPLEKNGPIRVDTLLRKSPDWDYEKEWRLLVPLTRVHQTRQNGPAGQAIHLLCFPEAAIRTLVLGARITDMQVADIVARIRGSQRWQHVTVLRAALSANEFALETRGV